MKEHLGADSCLTLEWAFAAIQSMSLDCKTLAPATPIQTQCAEAHFLLIVARLAEG